ncbi:hypothetical protein CYMTET_37451 [Cymbomonas tetramitiformis]|uniref:Kinesin motor domain-containing protein n=1 Tax=Cymbomonas tetramitiformis TaxID=36881 RepID=A0AAE0CDX4_9CHLO|nr:hypothetical protein CYMTET_37451 [Cymbomonas tetramitiformis]
MRAWSTAERSREAGRRSSSKHDDGALLKRSSSKKLAPATPIIPFRESKLTRILAESLTGGSFCIMLACIIANDALLGQTEGTLGYASDARRIKQVVRRNKRLERAEKVQREVRLARPCRPCPR